MTYNEVLDHIKQQQDDDEKFWRFKSILNHKSPISQKSPEYKGSKVNLLIKWEDGSRTYEPLDIIAEDDPLSCALYAKEKGLLDKPGWKRFKAIARREKKLTRMINQAKRKSFCEAPKFMFGYQVPRTPEEALEFDKKNGNTKWGDAIKLETSQLFEYKTFVDYGKGGDPPKGSQKIRLHWVFAVKHDGRHKARCVAGGHLTPPSVESVYSGVVSMTKLRLMIFLGELNDLELYGADIGNAYLKAKTKEKVHFVADKGFGELEGHTMGIYKALYGLKTSGKRWYERMADVLKDMGFKMSKIGRGIWMRDCGNHYEYIAVYVDDLAIALKRSSRLDRHAT